MLSCTIPKKTKEKKMYKIITKIYKYIPVLFAENSQNQHIHYVFINISNLNTYCRERDRERGQIFYVLNNGLATSVNFGVETLTTSPGASENKSVCKYISEHRFSSARSCSKIIISEIYQFLLI